MITIVTVTNLARHYACCSELEALMIATRSLHKVSTKRRYLYQRLQINFCITLNLHLRQGSWPLCVPNYLILRIKAEGFRLVSQMSTICTTSSASSSQVILAMDICYRVPPTLVLKRSNSPPLSLISLQICRFSQWLLHLRKDQN